MKIIASIHGGSHLYGLNTPESDLDERFVYLHDNINDIVGLGKNEFIDHRDGTTDKFGYELRNFLASLRTTNSQAMELLFAPEDMFLTIHPVFKEVRKNRYRLVDPYKFYKSLKGYIQAERKLANGERTGKLGGKRKEALDKYGFSPKNFVQLLRLSETGCAFYGYEQFFVNMRDYSKDFADQLIDIKTHPENYKKEELNKLSLEAEVRLEKAYVFWEGRPNHAFHYDETVANQLIFDAYFPMLSRLYAQQKEL